MIEQISHFTTAYIRQSVLWPEKPILEQIMPEDPHGYHFGYFQDGQLVGVISVFIEKTEARFRKLAVLESFQNRGIGKALIDHVLGFSKQFGVKTLWCDARTSAQAFYTNQGFEVLGAEFYKEGVEYVKMATSTVTP